MHTVGPGGPLGPITWIRQGQKKQTDKNQLVLNKTHFLISGPKTKHFPDIVAQERFWEK